MIVLIGENGTLYGKSDWTLDEGLKERLEWYRARVIMLNQRDSEDKEVIFARLMTNERIEHLEALIAYADINLGAGI